MEEVDLPEILQCARRQRLFQWLSSAQQRVASLLIATVSSLSGMLEREVYIVAGHSGLQVLSFSLVGLNRWGLSE